MSASIQIFVYNTKPIVISNENDYPLIRFDSKEDSLNFIRNLKSQPLVEKMEEAYFVINNMQLIQHDIRVKHQYKTLSLYVDSSDDECDDGGDNKYYMRDGCFSIRDNYELLMSCVIDNNTNSEIGFNEYLCVGV